MNNAEYLAMMSHHYYEELAFKFGYQTREESAVPWADVPGSNKQLMIAVAEKLLNGHVQIIEKEGEQELNCDDEKCLCLPTGKAYKYCPVHRNVKD